VNDRKHIKLVPRPAKPSNVTPLDAPRRTYVEPIDVMELVSYVDATDAGGLALAITAPPDGVPAWLVSSPEQVEQLGVAMVQLAGVMRARKGGSE
jgi:hypothetical protein